MTIHAGLFLTMQLRTVIRLNKKDATMTTSRIDRRSFMKVGTALATGIMAAEPTVEAESRPADLPQGHKTNSPRPVTVAAISGGLENHVGGGTMTTKCNVDRAIGCMKRLASCKPDLIVLTEHFHNAAVPGSEKDQGIAADHEIVQQIAAAAKSLHANVICPIRQRRGNRSFNTALWLDRTGRVAGRYDKIHPTESEIDEGVTCGAVEPSILNMDFGRVGVQICFDLNWPAGWSALRKAGAEIIAWPSAYAGGRPLPAMAFLHQVYILTATWPRRCKLFDISGDLITECGRLSDSIIETIDLDRRLFHWDYQGDKLDAIRARYGRDVNIDIYHEEGWFALNSLRDGLNTTMLMEEFNLVPLADYLKRATAKQDEHRIGS